MQFTCLLVLVAVREFCEFDGKKSKDNSNIGVSVQQSTPAAAGGSLSQRRGLLKQSHPSALRGTHHTLVP